MILRVKSLTKSFGGIRAVSNVSLEVKERELSSIIGPNGAGKTTLFNLLTGYHRKDYGIIEFMGEDVSTLPPHKIVKKGIGRSFQLVSLFNRMTVFENVQTAVLGGRNMSLNLFRPAIGMVREETYEIIESLNLEERADIVTTDLSYGEQRKVELGIALASKPHLLFLDEPCAGLSAEETDMMIELIQKIYSKGSLSVVLVEHKMDVIFAISQKIRVLYQGEIIFEGSPQDVKKSDEVLRVYLGEEIE